MGVIGDSVLTFIKVVVTVWGALFGWVYKIFTNPTLVRQNYKKVRSLPDRLIRPEDNEVVYQPVELPMSDFLKELYSAKCETLTDLWNWSVRKYRDRKLLGTRDILGEEDEIQPNGKMFKKLELGSYRWISYEEADALADNFGRGLRVLGHKPSNAICMFADTRAEWMLSTQGGFKQGFPVVTIYTNLGEEAVIHGLKETQVETVVTSHELLPKFKNILRSQEDSVKTIIYFENPIKRTNISGYRDDVRLISFWDVVSLGKKTSNNNLLDVDAEPVAPTPDSPAIIMYTSGSTGNPKGVVITHHNLVSSLTSLLYHLSPRNDDVYIAYLPLAHVLELLGESMMVIWGISIGYSGPNTLTDKSTMIKRGQSGDASVLRPSIMFCVPLILDRIYKGVSEQIKKRGEFTRRLMDFCVKYKLKCTRDGESTPIMDRLMFGSIRGLVGGRVRAILSGGAPLAPDIHDYLRTVFGCPILQGYGLTETCACATAMYLDENSTGRVGPPVQKTRLKLVNWEEGNYRVTDKPYPRGEIIIGGGHIASGYYKLPEKTAEEFIDDEAGWRWFKTGDIGQMHEDGTLKIIDRKKDLVKLQFGEYVSLGKVESQIKSCPVVSNLCIYGDPTKSYVVAIICPVPDQLRQLAAKYNKGNLSMEELCQDKDVTGTVLREVVNHCKQSKLEKFEIPGAVCLTIDEWTPDSGLTTAAMKLKRRPLQERYQADIDRMYGKH